MKNELRQGVRDITNHHIKKNDVEFVLGIKLINDLSRALEQSEADNARLREALKVFAECCDQIDDDEDDDEWAKFRLEIKDYRLARKALQETQP